MTEPETEESRCAQCGMHREFWQHRPDGEGSALAHAFAPPVRAGETEARESIDAIAYDLFEAGWFDNHGESIAEAWAERGPDIVARLRAALRTGAERAGEGGHE